MPDGDGALEGAGRGWTVTVWTWVEKRVLYRVLVPSSPAEEEEPYPGGAAAAEEDA